MSLVGWEQSYDPQNQIDEELTQSESGLTYQGCHPLVTLENIASIIPDNFTYQYQSWSAGTYDEGAKVKHNGKIWKAIEQTAEEPSDEASAWKEYNFLSDYLKTLTKNSIANMVQTFLTTKQLLKETKNLLERRTFFDGAGRLKDTTENKGNLVGIEITPVRSMGVSTKIERLGLQFAGGNGIVKVYVFHSDSVEPVKTFDLNYTANGGMQWFILPDCVLPYVNGGGSWYVCYNQDDLPEGMEAVNYTKDWSREPCGTCNRGNLEVWRELTKYMNLSPFYVRSLETFAEYPEMFDVQDIMYTNTHNYGMNMEVTVGCDLTQFIIDQRMVFANCLQKEVANMVLSTIAMNPDVRVNRKQSNVSRLDVLAERDGDSRGRESGIASALRQAYKALEIDTRGIDRICLTCQPNGIKYRTV